jgi:hypothetical protein
VKATANGAPRPSSSWRRTYGRVAGAAGAPGVAQRNEDDEAGYTPAEAKRKAEFERILGESLEWPEYWKMLDAWYAEREALEEEEYEDCIRSYVFRIDRGNEKEYASDRGAHTYGAYLERQRPKRKPK